MNTYIVKCIVFLLLIITLNSCVSLYHHIPNCQPIPSYHKKNEIQLSGAIGDPQDYFVVLNPPLCFNFNAGYSITNHIFADFTTLSSEQNDVRNINLHFFENGFGIGYFKSTSTFSYGARISALWGNLTITTQNPFPDDKNFNANTTIYSFCPFIGYEKDIFQVTFQLAISTYHFWHIDNTLAGIDFNSKYKEINSFENIFSPFNLSYIEPSLSLKAGPKFAKLFIQDVYCIPLNHKTFSFKNSCIYFGAEISIHL